MTSILKLINFSRVKILLGVDIRYHLSGYTHLYTDKPNIRNEVQRKIMKKGNFLNPYTMWKTQLVNTGVLAKSIYEETKKFRSGDLRVELAGHIYGHSY